MADSLRRQLQAELLLQSRRTRNRWAYVAVAAMPLLAALAHAGSAHKVDSSEGGLYRLANLSALNHTMASLAFFASGLLPTIVIALLLADAVAGPMQDGSLRYVLLRPVSRTRVVLVKSVLVATHSMGLLFALAVSSLLSGAAVFGFGSLRLTSNLSVPVPEGLLRVAVAALYLAACAAVVGAIALVTSIATRSPTLALASTIGLTAVAAAVQSFDGLGVVRSIAFVHYWARWESLASPGIDARQLLVGAAVQLAWVCACVVTACAIFNKRNYLQ